MQEFCPRLIGTNRALGPVEFVNPTTGYLLVSEEVRTDAAISANFPRRIQVLKTMDAGATWSEVFRDNTDFSSSPVAKVKLDVVDAQTVFVSLNDSPVQQGDQNYHGTVRIWRTTDGGLTWNMATIPASHPSVSKAIIQDIDFCNAQLGFGVGCDLDDPRNAFVVKTIDGGVNWSLESVNPYPTGKAYSPQDPDILSTLSMGARSR